MSPDRIDERTRERIDARLKRLEAERVADALKRQRERAERTKGALIAAGGITALVGVLAALYVFFGGGR